MFKNSFLLDIPLSKNYTNDKGDYHLAFSISTTETDSYGDKISENALNSMLTQIKGLTINADHNHDLNNIIGPVVDAWIEKQGDTSYLWVDVNVRKKWIETIKDMVNAGVALGGSIEVSVTNIKDTSADIRVIDNVKLYGAALTSIPANNATLGTATTVNNGCPGSLCMQLEKKLKENINLEARTLLKTEEIKENNLKNDEKEEETKNSLNLLLEKVSDKVEQLSNKLSPELEEESDEVIDNSDDLKEKMELKRKNLELEREVLTLKTENKKLKNSIDVNEQNKLIKKALKLNKKLDPNTQIINKETLFKEIETFSNDTDNRDIFLQLESYNKGLELILKKVPQGDIPQKTAYTLENSETKASEEIIKRSNRLRQAGRGD